MSIEIKIPLGKIEEVKAWTLDPKFRKAKIIDGTTIFQEGIMTRAIEIDGEIILVKETGKLSNKPPLSGKLEEAAIIFGNNSYVLDEFSKKTGIRDPRDRKNLIC